jgi:Fe-S oxidoreductase
MTSNFTSPDDVRWIPMLFALAAAFAYFGVVMLGKVRLLLAGVHRREYFSNLALRFANVMTYAIGQKKMFKETKAGVMHAFIFWGFLVLQIRTAYLIIIAFAPDFQIPFIHLEYSLTKDITEAIVFTMILYAVYRRVVIKPARLTQSVEALVVLGMIGGLILTDFFYDAFLFAGHTASGGIDPHIAAEMQYAPVGAALASLFSDWTPEMLIGLKETCYWAHIFIVLTFLNMLPGSKHFHVITSIPNVMFSDVTPKGAIRPIHDIELQETFGVGDVTDLDWSQMLDLYSCTECGRCSVNCPTTITGKVLNPKLLICDTRDNLYAHEASILGKKGWGPEANLPSLIEQVKADAIWDCTTCRACSEACPVMIEHVDKIIDMRRHLVLMEADFPKELAATFKNLENKGNPWGLPASERGGWTEGLDVPTVDEKPDAEYIFWSGCAGAYDDRQKKVSRALVRVMQAADLSFAILGEEESCTGDPARRAGNEYLFQILAQANVDLWNERGLNKKKLITHCPHCFNTIKNEYPQFGGHFEAIHHSELLAQLIREKRIHPTVTPENVGRVTYHDSCYIGRYNDVYEEPRDALRAIPGIELAEMKRNRTTGMCCGAGGSRVWMEEHRGARINQTRVEHVMETKSDTIAVACPFCHLMMADGVNEKSIEGVKTRDIAQLIADSLGN